jgi:hypothetical protein
MSNVKVKSGAIPLQSAEDSSNIGRHSTVRADREFK